MDERKSDSTGSMHILCVIDSLTSGGAQRQLVALACGLKQRGHTVEFFIYHPAYCILDDPLKENDIPVHAVQKGGRFSWRPVPALRQQLKSGEYDLAISFLDTPNLYLVLARIGRRRPIVVVSERVTYPESRLSVAIRILKQFHRLADHVTTNSIHHRLRMEAEFPWIKNRLSSIWNGTDLDWFSPAPEAGPNSDSESLRFLVVGRVTSQKNPLGLIRALGLYRDRHGIAPHVSWAGNHFESYDAAVNLLQEFNLEKNWTWLGERSDIPNLLRSHDALILCSFYEGLPNVVSEAMACGRPVLASNICDNPRLVQEGETGFLFDPHNPEDIARALHLFHQCTPLQRHNMGLQARRFAEEQLSLEHYVDQYETLFRHLLKS